MKLPRGAGIGYRVSGFGYWEWDFVSSDTRYPIPDTRCFHIAIMLLYNPKNILF